MNRQAFLKQLDPVVRWGSLVAAYIVLAVLLSPASGLPGADIDPVHEGVAYEWAMLPPEGDISPPALSGGAGFADGGSLAAGSDVVTQYLQRMMLSGAGSYMWDADSAVLVAIPVTHRHEAPGQADVSIPAPLVPPVPDPSPASVGADDAEACGDDAEACADADPGEHTVETVSATQSDEIPQGQETNGEREPVPATARTGDYPLPVEGEVLLGFGWLECPTLEEWIFHAGIDIAAEPGTPVLSVSGGRVAHVTSDASMGVTVVIALDDLRFIYSALGEALVAKDGAVSEGQEIGLVGRSPLREIGLPPHLHFEVRDAAEEPVEIYIIGSEVRLGPEQ